MTPEELRTLREARRYDSKSGRPDQRPAGARDRDRILYTPALRRLGGVTQIASAVEGHVFHTRLTHTHEVAQIALRTSQFLMATTASDVLEAVGGLDPDVAEAGALAHDLGHPPFGHTGENELQLLLAKDPINNTDSFEGNAQSFRIVTKLEHRYPDCPGLDLTRATLAAILKYPWLRDSNDPAQSKWGAYLTETEDFQFARQLFTSNDTQPSAEAEIMDFSDDVAYSVHDLEDFYRAGLVPLNRLILQPEELDRFIDQTYKRWEREKRSAPLPSELKDAARRVFELASIFTPLTEPYNGSRTQRAALKTLTSLLIGRYVMGGITLRTPDPSNPKRITQHTELLHEITILKELSWYYVIETPPLITQQMGQRRVIQDLFNSFMHEGISGNLKAFPTLYREEIESLGAPSDFQLARIVADMIAGMTEPQAIAMHQRVTGHGLGSVLDVILQG
ncbi:MAG: dNTP triphosphohydrolase [Chloroflexi bacterium]|nr:dNTP triphosphohydrolase [Chloroflexota bacterium]